MKEEVKVLDAELRRYLLGELSSDEEQKIEEQLLTNDSAIEQMLMVETELIDEYLAGRLLPHQQEKYRTLFLATREGRQKLESARVLKSQLAKFKRPEPIFLNRLQALMAQVFSPPVLQAVAALLVVGLGVFGWRMFMRQSEGIYLTERPLEARISGAAYAPFTGVAGINQTDAAKMKANERALHPSPDTAASPEALHKQAQAYLAQKDFSQALDKLLSALKLSPNDPTLHGDLAITFMELAKGEEGNAKAEDFAAAERHLKESLRLQSDSPEALFNLALLQQTQKKWKEAEAAWRQYLSVDSNSKWAKEAAQHLDAAVNAQKQ